MGVQPIQKVDGSGRDAAGTAKATTDSSASDTATSDVGAPIELAQSDTDSVTPSIGRVSDVVGSATATRVDGTRISLGKDAPIFEGDLVETGSDGALTILFVDQSTFTVGGDARLVLDELVFDASSLSGQSSVSVIEGVFVFVSGQIANSDPERMVVRTPVATIGVRGTAFAVEAHPEGQQTQIVLLPERAIGCVGQSGCEALGLVSVYNTGGSLVLDERLEAAVVRHHDAMPPDTTFLPPDELSALLKPMLGLLPGALRGLVTGLQVASDGEGLEGETISLAQIEPGAGDGFNAGTNTSNGHAVTPLDPGDIGAGLGGSGALGYTSLVFSVPEPVFDNSEEILSAGSAGGGGNDNPGGENPGGENPGGGSTPVIAISDATVIEGDTAIFTISLSKSATENLVVKVTTQDGSAHDGIGEDGAGIPDFTAVTEFVTFRPGETTAQISISTIDDDIFEPDESFTVTVSNGDQSESGTGEIRNDDFDPKGGKTTALIREAGIEAIDDVVSAGSDAESSDEIAEGTLDLSYGVDGPAASGAFIWSTIVGVDDPETAAPLDWAATSGGQPVIWQVSPDGLELRAIIDGGEHDGQLVATLTAVLDGNGPGTSVSFRYEQIAPFDHPDAGEREADDPVRLDFGFTIKDARGSETSGSLGVTMLDDAGDGATLAKADTVISGANQFNLAFVIDVSNSMSAEIPSGETKLEAAITALEALLKETRAAGVVGPILISAFHGKLVAFGSPDEVTPIVVNKTFASIGAALQEVAPGKSAVEAFFDQLFANQTGPAPNFGGNLGSTRYEGGLDAAADWFSGTLTGPGIVQPKPLAASDNRLFFLTDGGNNNGDGGFDPTALDVEKLYNGSIPNLTIKTVGIDTAGDFINDLDRTDDLDGTNRSIVIIDDLQSAQQLSAGFGDVEGGPGAAISSGNLLVDDDLIGGDGADGVVPVPGADGIGRLLSVSFIGQSGVPVTVTQSGTYETALGGKITIDFSDGDYIYAGPSGRVAGAEHFSFETDGGDGDRIAGVLDIVIRAQPRGPTASLSAADIFDDDILPAGRLAQHDAPGIPNDARVADNDNLSGYVPLTPMDDSLQRAAAGF